MISWKYIHFLVWLILSYLRLYILDIIFVFVYKHKTAFLWYYRWIITSYSCSNNCISVAVLVMMIALFIVTHILLGFLFSSYFCFLAGENTQKEAGGIRCTTITYKDSQTLSSTLKAEWDDRESDKKST